MRRIGVGGVWQTLGMDNALINLVLLTVFVIVTFGLRTLMQLKKTGSSGFHGISGSVGSAEWLGGVGFVLAFVLAFVAPALVLLEFGDAPAFESTAATALGIGFAVLGIALVFLSQVSMGESWRIGVDPAESTALVTGGAFAVVRNPIFSSMIPLAIGLLLLVPTLLSLVAFVLLAAAIELQVRRVEEPYLLESHPDYPAYAARVGRFLPGVGKIVG